MTIPESIQCFK